MFAHYLIASPDSADPVLLMRRLWEHLNRATGETVELPVGNIGLRDLAAGLAQRLSQAAIAAERRGFSIVIALDGLDKLSSEQNLRWLPSVLAPCVKLLASSLDGEAKDAAMARGWEALEIAQLDDEERQMLIADTLGLWGKSDLPPSRKKRMLAHPLSGLPLFLKTILEELRVSATEAVLDARLAAYLEARDMPDLFARMLDRLERDCDKVLVERALSLVWASRAGLEETEIIASTDATPLALAKLRNALGDNLRDQAGRITFSHDFLRHAVELRYLSSEIAKQATHLALADFFDAREPDTRQAEELPYQLRAAKAWDRLKGLLLDLDRFALLRARGDSEMLSYWQPLRERGHDPEILLCGALDAWGGEPSRWTAKDVDLACELLHFLSSSGAMGEASQRLGEQCTVACQRIYSALHPHTLTIANSLAVILERRGDLERAQTLQERILKVQTHVRGPEHPETLATMHNHARTLLDRGDFNAAQKVLEHVLEISTRLFGPEHTLTLHSMSSLSVVRAKGGDLGGAQELQERVLETRKSVLGPEQPDTLRSMSTLAHILSESGKLEDAQRLLEHALKVQMRILGSEHFDAHISMVELAKIFARRGDLERAQTLQERILKVQTHVRGPEHTVTLVSMSNLALTLKRRGDLGGAQELEERMSEILMRLFGPEHADTRSSLAILAETLSYRSEFAAALSGRGNLEGAQRIQDNILEVRRRLFGPEHPDTLTSMLSVASTLKGRGDLDGAQKLQEQVLEVMARLFGPEHLDTLVSVNNLADTLNQRGDFDAAQKLQQRVLETRARLLGPDHAQTLISMSNLAATLYRLGDTEGSQKLQEQVLEATTRLLGPDDSQTLTSMNNLAATFWSRGDRDGAQKLQERVHEATMRTLGAEHPDTRAAAENLSFMKTATRE